jgi:hypothetical protein
MAISSVDSRPSTSTTPPVATAVKQKAALNASILKATEANLSAKDQPLALILRATIDKLNSLLEADLGPNAIESGIESGLDVSPDATAERIVSLATAAFPAFQKANPDESGEELLNHFMDVIGGGIEQGFSEAQDILQGLGVLQGSIASDIDLTFDLVQEKLDLFKQSFSNQESVEPLTED